MAVQSINNSANRNAASIKQTILQENCERRFIEKEDGKIRTTICTWANKEYAGRFGPHSLASEILMVPQICECVTTVEKDKKQNRR